LNIPSLLCALLLLGHSLAVAEILGQWQLDVDNSDDVTAILTEASAKNRKKPKWGSGKDEQSPGQWRIPLPLVQAKSLVLRMQGEELAIRPDIGKPVVIVPNQGAASVSLSGWGSRKQGPVRFGTWEGDTLIVESALDDGTRVIQSYYVDTDGLLAQDTEVLRSSGDPVLIKRKFRNVDKRGSETSR
jgi:hypothetical protein